jgi:hypothetical protein
MSYSKFTRVHQTVYETLDWNVFIPEAQLGAKDPLPHKTKQFHKWNHRMPMPIIQIRLASEVVHKRGIERGHNLGKQTPWNAALRRSSIFAANSTVS